MLERTEWYGKGLFRSASRSEIVCFQNYKNRNRLPIRVAGRHYRNSRLRLRSNPRLSTRLF
ncbi:hypothetical protein BURMUCGD2M_0709 [Burkholderia multivorans CGD2M]|uniref:Uncharacterized protein n=1 Tax=Burkholderia multivorans CGD2 TaxID=513052 RepID=B9BU47_9BURK|nr:hypothetical protein BURMUCGD2_0619 [Burkholderia multivorans CGD2]EEE12613.1 hypothetical protein BURMUCGD2M_0709 [Burkholderia multivorans CGD2M]